MIKIKINVETDNDFKLVIPTHNPLLCSIKYDGSHYKIILKSYSTDTKEELIKFLKEVYVIHSTKDYIEQEFNIGISSYFKQLETYGLISCKNNLMSGNYSLWIDIREINDLI